jgi:hypothetical protein
MYYIDVGIQTICVHYTDVGIQIGCMCCTDVGIQKRCVHYTDVGIQTSCVCYTVLGIQWRCVHYADVHVLHRYRLTDKMCTLHSCRHWAGSVHCTDVGLCNAIIYHVGCVYFYLTATLGVLVKVVFWEPDTASLTNTPQTEAFCEVRSLTFHRCVKIIFHSWWSHHISFLYSNGMS